MADTVNVDTLVETVLPRLRNLTKGYSYAFALDYYRREEGFDAIETLSDLAARAREARSRVAELEARVLTLALDAEAHAERCAEGQAQARVAELEAALRETTFCLGIWESAVGEINVWPGRCRSAMKLALAALAGDGGGA